MTSPTDRAEFTLTEEDLVQAARLYSRTSLRNPRLIIVMMLCI